MNSRTIDPTSAFCDIPKFRPHALLRNGHLQTIVGAYWWGPVPPYCAARHEALLADGDRILLHDDRPETWSLGDPAVLLLHGLSGSHASPYVARTADKLRLRGIRTFRMDLRGCGAGARLARGPLHAGRSEDAAAALTTVAAVCPGSPVFVIGFSMGGNIILKMVGEMGDAAPSYLRAIIAVAPPIDLAATCRNLASGVNTIYDRRFVRSLLLQLENRRCELPDAYHRELTRRPRTVYEFDDWVTAPLAGFADADDYYQQASSGPLLARVRVPTLILAAADDPLVPATIFQCYTYSDAVRLHITEGGGHVGYIGAAGDDPDRRWMEWRIVEQITWLAKQQESLSLALHRT